MYYEDWFYTPEVASKVVSISASRWPKLGTHSTNFGSSEISQLNC